MSYITFTHGKEDGQKWNQDEFKLDYELIYVSVEAGDTGGSMSGWVSAEVRQLIHAAPANQRKVYEHEKFVSDLYGLMKIESFDYAMDLVREKYEAIHGPSDIGDTL
jgi:hypothetical protein